MGREETKGAKMASGNQGGVRRREQREPMEQMGVRETEKKKGVERVEGQHEKGRGPSPTGKKILNSN